MKITTKIALVSALLIALFAGVAVAATFTCTATTCNGTPNNDRITGGGASQTFNAKAGNDNVQARSGDDTVNGEQGRDILFGELGCDTLDGGPAPDFLNNTTNDNCAKALSNPDHEVSDAQDGNPNDRIVTNDNRPDEIVCDTGDTYKADAQTDEVNGAPVPGAANQDVTDTC